MSKTISEPRSAKRRAARKDKAPPAPSPASRRRQLRFSTGARSREIGGVVIIALAVLSLLALAGLTRGSLSDWWSNGLYQLFGWGAFAFAGLLGAIGIMLLVSTTGRLLAFPWRAIIFGEIAFVALLVTLHAFASNPDTWKLAIDGEGGGMIGWGLLSILEPFLGRTAVGILFALIMLFALTLALRVPWGDWLIRLTERLIPPPSNETAAPPRLLGSATEPPPAATSAEIQIVPPQQVTITPKRLDQPPVQATQLPLTITTSEEPPPPKIKHERVLPAADVLEGHTTESIEQEEIERKKEVIEKTLRQFGLEAKVVRVSQGPAVTQYGVEPGYIERAAGPEGEVRRQKVRVAQISSLQNDLALALAAPSLRIEAPVPGQSFVGIEVPNDAIEMVGLRGVLDSEAFEKLKAKAPLACALGRDVSGTPVAADLAAMPHVLIAGTTGSGKSVCINTMIMSLIMNNMPDDLRLVMIDPKMVELIRYNGLPHLYGKVETELERIVNVLRWVTREMDGRYKKFADLGVRHIAEYNAQMIAQGQDKLPFMAVFIDELSDLMMSAPVEIEKTICRIAQMARATGIHLVIATQRPSTDVVTGLIKANFPARIAFAVASGVDSRVILDGVGAETLLGRGDMLFLSPTANGPVRVQGCYVGEREIDRVVEFWNKEYAGEAREPAPWETTRLAKMEEIAQSSPATARYEDDDEVLLAKAIELVKKQRQASASLLQRKMNLGYPKAAFLIDRMEEMGVIGPEQKAGRTRVVLIGADEDTDEWL